MSFCISSDSAITTGPGRPRDRDVHRVRDDFRDALRLVDLRHPLGERGEHLPVVHFLERIAAGVLVRDLADEQQQRRAVLHRDVHADRAMAGTRTARHHRRGGPALQLAERLGHVHRARLEAAGHQLQLLAHLVQAVEHVEIAFARARRTRGRCLARQAHPPARALPCVGRCAPCAPEPVPFQPPLRPVRSACAQDRQVARVPSRPAAVRKSRSAQFRTIARSLDGVCSPQIGQNVRQFPPLPHPNDWVSAEPNEQEVPRCYRA